jgi:hypothetical protein
MIRRAIRSVFGKSYRRVIGPSKTAAVVSTGNLLVDSFPVLVDGFPVVFS